MKPTRGNTLAVAPVVFSSYGKWFSLDKLTEKSIQNDAYINRVASQLVVFPSTLNRTVLTVELAIVPITECFPKHYFLILPLLLQSRLYLWKIKQSMHGQSPRTKLLGLIACSAIALCQKEFALKQPPSNGTLSCSIGLIGNRIIMLIYISISKLDTTMLRFSRDTSSGKQLLTLITTSWWTNY